MAVTKPLAPGFKLQLSVSPSNQALARNVEQIWYERLLSTKEASRTSSRLMENKLRDKTNRKIQHRRYIHELRSYIALGHSVTSDRSSSFPTGGREQV